MRISTIVAVAANNVIGHENQIPWYLPADLKYFKRTTLNHHILMGRKNYLSIGRPLPKRVNIVVTRDVFFNASGTIVVHSIEEGIEIARQAKETELFIIGGGEIYRQCMPITDRIYLTEIKTEAAGDVYFPEIDEQSWGLVSEERHEPDEKNKYAYTFKIYDRKK
ncbi:MAG: dihydrofolate reductase [Saprospirales bacterium]|nr:MAG: dihydrofolate reductase [Saprospirales bacterium]